MNMNYTLMEGLYLDPSNRNNILCKCANAPTDDINKAINKLREYIYDIAYMESLQTGRPIREMNAQLQRLPH